jgi:putative protease
VKKAPAPRKTAKPAPKAAAKAPPKRAAPAPRPAAAAKPAAASRPAAKAAAPKAFVTLPAIPPPFVPKAAPAAAPPPAEDLGERIGVVTHYYGHVGVAVVRLDGVSLRVGDIIRVRGHTTDFTQRVVSLEVEHRAVTEVGPNDDFGMRVKDHVREHDVVYRVR